MVPVHVCVTVTPLVLDTLKAPEGGTEATAGATAVMTIARAREAAASGRNRSISTFFRAAGEWPLAWLWVMALSLRCRCLHLAVRAGTSQAHARRTPRWG